MRNAFASTMREILGAAGAPLSIANDAEPIRHVSLDNLVHDARAAEAHLETMLERTAEAAVRVDETRRALAGAINAINVGVRAVAEEHRAVAEMRALERDLQPDPIVDPEPFIASR
jgi:hypothetical protein